MGDEPRTAATDERPEVVHRPELERFEVSLDGHTAVLEYKLVNSTMIFTHTGVPPEFEGRGVGSQLVRTGLEYVRENGLVAAPVCPFVRSFIREHPEYRELVGFGERGERIG